MEEVLTDRAAPRTGDLIAKMEEAKWIESI